LSDVHEVKFDLKYLLIIQTKDSKSIENKEPDKKKRFFMNQNALKIEV